MLPKNNQTNLPIGIFDSGIGGLTNLSALRIALPNESFIYLGDTARLPYGTKSGATIERYTRQVAELLFNHGIKLLVIACNTATTYGLIGLQQSHPFLPVIGVIEPGAQKACEISKTGHIGVLSTEATARGGAYPKAIHRIRPEAKIIAQSCGLFISLVEEGFAEGIVAEEVAKTYLSPLLKQSEDFEIDCLLLGCTHFPVLTPVLRSLVPHSVKIVDSAQTTAEVVRNFLIKNNLMRKNTATAPDNIQFWVTDSPERFARIGTRILGTTIAPETVELVDMIS